MPDFKWPARRLSFEVSRMSGGDAKASGKTTRELGRGGELPLAFPAPQLCNYIFDNNSS